MSIRFQYVIMFICISLSTLCFSSAAGGEDGGDETFGTIRLAHSYPSQRHPLIDEDLITARLQDLQRSIKTRQAALEATRSRITELKRAATGRVLESQEQSAARLIRAARIVDPLNKGAQGSWSWSFVRAGASFTGIINSEQDKTFAMHHILETITAGQRRKHPEIASWINSTVKTDSEKAEQALREEDPLQRFIKTILLVGATRYTGERLSLDDTMARQPAINLMKRLIGHYQRMQYQAACALHMLMQMNSDDKTLLFPGVLELAEEIFRRTRERDDSSSLLTGLHAMAVSESGGGGGGGEGGSAGGAFAAEPEGDGGGGGGGGAGGGDGDGPPPSTV